MTINANLLSRLRSIDWDFTGALSDSPFSAIHWHPCRFASQVPATLIGLLTAPGDIVLDPFVGSGTTLVEAQRLGRRSIGIDVNPVACIAARAKTLRLNATAIRRTATILKDDARRSLDRQLTLIGVRRAPVPSMDKVQLSKWYTRRVANDLLLLWGTIEKYSGTKRTLAQAAFSSLLLTVCRETRHWGYVCDNSTPKGNHEGHVLTEYTGTLDRLCNAYVERDAEIHARSDNMTIPDATVRCGDALEVLRSVDPASVDCIVTSPPYFGVCDYVKAQRLSAEWFDVDIESHRQKEIGARSKRHRLTAHQDYLGELERTITECARCLKRDKYCVLIIGESEKRESVISEMRHTLSNQSMSVVADINRRVSTQRRQAPSIVSEHVMILRKGVR